MFLKVSWQKYRVKEKKNPKVDGEMVDGYFNPIKSEIGIEKKLSKKNKQEVLIHEVIHAILFNYGHTDKYQDENLVESITSGIMQVIYDNEKNIFEKVGG